MKMKGYKAFSHGMICRKGEYNEKQYAEHTTYEESGGEICNEGMMHFCANPLDCLDYYPLIDDDGNIVEIAEVEADDPVTYDNKKYASKKLHIGAKIDIKNLGSISAQVIRETVEREIEDIVKATDNANQVAERYANQVAGYHAKQVAADHAKQVATDNANQVAGYNAKQVATDNANQVAGYHAKQVAADHAKQVAERYAKQVAERYAKQQAGENSILVAGKNSIFKAGLHSVVLHYWYNCNGNIGGFKAAQVDGVNIKADTWYRLQDGEFVEVIINDTDMR